MPKTVSFPIENDQARGSLKNMFPSTRAWGESRRTDLHFCDVDTHAVFATSCPVRELNGESAVEQPKFSEEFIYRYIGPIHAYTTSSALIYVSYVSCLFSSP